MNFNNKVVIVTGASSGIGMATAVEFAKLRAKVVIAGRNVDNLAKTAKLCVEAGAKQEDIYSVPGDLEKTEDCNALVDKTIEKYGKVDVLVNNAGTAMIKGVQDCSLDDMDKMFNIHVRAVFATTQRALPSLIENKGAIVNVSSIFAQVKAVGFLPYSVAKAAQDHYTKCVALGVADKGVRVNAVSPGLTRTSIVGYEHQKLPSGRTIGEALEKTGEYIHSNNRCATVEDVARAILFLAWEENIMISGSCLPVDGCVLAEGVPLEKVEFYVNMCEKL